MKNRTILEERCGIEGILHQFKFNFELLLNKQNPDNFKVFEILSDKSILGLSKKDQISSEINSGLFYHGILSKKLIDTPGAVNLIAKRLKIHLNWIGYAGLKDAYGETHQRISIFNFKQQNINSLKFNNFSVHSLQREKYEVNLGDLYGNYFEIVLDMGENSITDLNEFKDEINKKINIIREKGFPNFFGLQRFGSKRPISHLMGKYILLENYEDAVQSYLTTTSDFENEKISASRIELSESGDLNQFISNIPSHYGYEILLAKSLLNYPKNYYRAFNQIPNGIKKLFIHSYQSYIFNQIVSHLIQNESIENYLGSTLPLITAFTDIKQLPKNLEDVLLKLLDKDRL